MAVKCLVVSVRVAGSLVVDAILDKDLIVILNVLGGLVVIMSLARGLV